MPQPPPARAGDPIDVVDTPALIVDLDAFEDNLQVMAAACRAAGVRLRPHAKTHKCAAIALRQIALGAVGVCCQKVSEAEALVYAGVRDVLISNEVVGAAKLRRLAALAVQARIGVCVDAADTIAALSAAVVAAGSEVDVLVEIDVGSGRCGVAPGEPALALALAVDAAAGLRFAGLQAYHGSAQHLREPDQRAAAVAAASDAAQATAALIGARGLDCATIAGAGTGTYPFEAGSGVYNELQPGSYIFMDADYARNRGAADAARYRHSLFILTTIMSRPTPERAVVDAGHKSASIDSGLPEVVSPDGAGPLRYRQASDEHGVLDVAAAAADAPALALGARLRLIPGHCDPTVNLHDWLIGVRAGRVETVWPVDARGALF